MRVFLALLLLSAGLVAQSAQELVRQGDQAARNDRHAEAIRDYEAALQADASLRAALLPKLGRQYLWSEQSAKAAVLLGEYVSAHPEDCELRSDYATALSWSNQLKRARSQYQTIQQRCPERRISAMLGEGRILRWQDKPLAADRVYAKARSAGDSAQQRDAEMGMAFDALSLDDNRKARAAFQRFIAGGADSGLYEGLAVANMHLGLPDFARDDIAQARQHNMMMARLVDLDERIGRLDDPQVGPSFTFFRDADGTNYFGSEVDGGIGWMLRGRARAFVGASHLSSANQVVTGRWGRLNVEHRFSETLALRGEARGTHYGGAGFDPFTGELDAILTPTDRQRFDLSLARIVIADNIAALRNHMIGTFGSGSTDWRFRPHDTLSLALDGTAWSDGNRRIRFRVDPQHQFEGVPRVTVSLPMLYQNYDRSFSFPLFSPKSYTEIGPAVNVYWRKAKYWSFSLYGRVGGQKEAALAWGPLGTFRATAERELVRDWGFHAAVAYSTSNLASSTGFSRTSVTAGFVRRF